MRGDISMGHARAVLTAPIRSSWLVKSSRRACRSGRRKRSRGGESLVSPKRAALPQGGKQQAADADIAALERQLGDILGLKVKVATDGCRGTVTLHYSSLDQLDMICQRLSDEQI
jgi:ParB family transcriptional regulator, chromosome partitioning protein